MMNIVKHDPIFDPTAVEDIYTNKDGVPVRYVCTTEIESGSGLPVDIFYRGTPHPEFGNRYFGIIFPSKHGVAIMDADRVEELTFDCVKDSEGGLHYSQHRHDFRTTDNGNFIDGGRLYTRASASELFTRVVRDGKMVEYSEAME